MQDTTEAELDKLLAVFLTTVAAPSQPNSDQSRQNLPGPTVLEQCLTAVNPLCNPPVKRANGNAEAYAARTEAYEESVAGYMKDYCKPGLSEIDRRPPFVKLSNAVLELVGAEDSPLKELLRRPDDTRILLHINHPQRILSTADGSKVTRIPGIVIIAEESARDAFDKVTIQSRSELLEQAALPTHLLTKTDAPKQFPLPALLSSVVLKRVKPNMEQPRGDWPTMNEPKLAPPKPISKDGSVRQMKIAEEAYCHTSGRTQNSMLAASDIPPTGETPGETSSPIGTRTVYTGQNSKLDDVDDITSEPQKTNRQRTPEDIKLPGYRAVVESASYALQGINRAAGALKIINMIVEDQTLWLRIYDRQGVIQSCGLDFVKDFPRFVVLLAAFQRFNRQDWGFNPELEPPARVNSTAPIELTFTSSGHTYKVTLTNDILYERRALCGRATRVETVTVERDGEVFNDDEYVLKIGWPESARINEVKIIAAAQKIADQEEKGQRYITGHLPEVICSKDLPESHATGAIRNALGLPPKETRGGSRTCRLIVLVKLREITSLPPLDFLRLFRQIVDCHYSLWINGIRHCDVSLGNLMWHPRTGLGVLNDFDLSRMGRRAQPKNLERTGTVPFLSLDILSNPNFQHGRGLIEATYKHDCDSFKWVFLYVCCIDTPNSAVQRWFTSDPLKCLHVKKDFLLPLGKVSEFVVSSKYMALYGPAYRVFNDLSDDLIAQLKYPRSAYLRQFEVVAERTVPQPRCNGAPSSPHTPLEEPEGELAPLPVDLWAALKIMMDDL